MTHSLTLEVPENIYQPLVAEAEAKGRKVEEIAIEKLAKNGQTRIGDPLDKFIGAFESNISDWADKHDYYLSENLAEDLKPHK